MNKLKVYWHRQVKNPNFGDEISPMIVAMVSNRQVEHSTPEECDVAGIGSILWKVLDKYVESGRSSRMVVWGSGFMQPIRFKCPKNVEISLVRGPLTNYSFPNVGPIPHGDPGLLADRLFESIKPNKDIRIGIVPHQGEKTNPLVGQIAHAARGAAIININGSDVVEIARNIKRCDFIVSSSLHGLIVADSFGIPNIWLKMGDIHPAAEYKFYDYFATVGRGTRKYSAHELLSGIRDDMFDDRYFDSIDSVKGVIMNSWSRAGF